MKSTHCLPFLLVFIISLASCSGDATTGKELIADSAKMKLPEDLVKLNAAIESNSDNADAWHGRAKYYLGKKQYDAGFEDMKKVMMLDSSKAEYFITLSDLYFMTNQTGNSKAALEKCLSLDDKNVNAMLKLAEIYFFVKKHDKCFEYINMALKVDKYNPKAYFMKGMTYKELKDTAKAISSMQTAVEQDQTFYNAYMQLGLLNAAQKKAVAVDYYKNALRVNPNSTEVWYGIGKYYQDVGNFEKSLEAYKVLVELDPQNKYAYYNMGAMDLADKKTVSTASLAHFSKAIQIDPAYFEAYYGRGMVNLILGNKADAKRDFEDCLKLKPDFEPAILALKGL